MTVALAELAMKVDSRDVATGVLKLDDLTAAGKRTEAQAGKTATAHDRLAAETRKAGAAMEQTVQAANDLNRRAIALKATYDPLAASVDRVNRELAEASALYKAGAISAGDFARANTLLTARLNGLNVAHAASAKGARLQTGEIVNLGRQFADVGVQAALLQNPLLILIQQGPQIADVFATANARGVGFKAALKGIGESFGPLLARFALIGGVIGGVAVALGLLAKAFFDGEKEANAFANTLKATGNFAGLTGVQFEQMSAKVAEATNGGLGNTREALIALVSSGKLTGATIEVLGEDVVRLGQLTGQSGAKVAAEFAKMGGDVAAFATTFNEQYHLLTAAQVEHIRLLQEQGRVTDAQLQLAIDIHKRLGQEGPAELGYLEEAWRGVSNAIGEAWANIKGFGNESVGRSRRLDELNAQIAALENGRGRVGLVRVPGDNSDARRLQTLRAERLALTFVTQQEEARAKQQSANAQAEQTAIRAQEEHARTYRSLGDNVAAARQEIERYRKGQADIRKVNPNSRELDSPARAVAIETEILKKYTPEATRAANAAERLAERLARQLLKEQVEALRDFTQQMSKSADEADRFARSWEKLSQPLNLPDVDLAVSAGASQQYADTLALLADDTDALAQRTVSAAQLMADAFGNVGAAIGDLATVQADYQARQSAIFARQAQDIADHQKARADAGNDSKKINDAERAFAMKRIGTERQLRDAETARNLDSIRSAKGFFKEKSAAYKVLTGLEVAMQATQLAGLAVDAIATAKSIGNSILRTAAYAKEAIANAFKSTPFPFNFAAAAAVAAGLVAFGVKVLGGGGGGGASVPTAEERQEAQGTGSVLGDASAKSESIARALDIVAANTNRDLEYSNGMLRALRSIDQNIGTLTAALARQLGVGGALDTSDLGLGTSTSGPGTLTKLLAGPISLLAPGLFGKTTTKTLLDQGLTFDPQSLEAILNGGLSGASFQDVETKTKKKFFGVTVSNKSKTSTTETPLEGDILAEIQRVIGSLRSGVLEAAGALGVEGAGAALQAFTVNLGEVSFKDKTGEEIQQELNAVFGKLGDELSIAVLPELAKLQKAGEGAFETLVRVARQYQVIDVTLSSIGKTFGAVGVASLEAREGLISLFGSLDDFVEQTQFFADTFLSEAERIAPIQAAVQKEFARLGVTGVNTKDQFKQLVLGLDLTTQAGQEMYAAMLAVAPAFSKVIEFLTEGSQDVADARDALAEAYEREAGALQETIDKFDGFAKSLRAFRQSLDTGPNALLSPEAQYLATQAKFNDVSARAKLGDAEALGDLQNVSQAYLDASKAYYASSGKYFADLTSVKVAVEAAQGTAQRTADNATQQLDALKQSVAGLIEINKSVLSVQAAIVALRAAMGVQAGAPPTVAPFSPTTSATGSTAPGFTFTPPAVTPTTGATTTQPNWASYLTHYADVLAEANRVVANGEFATAQAYAQWHFENFGRAEGRTPFETGGSFSVPGAGPKDFGPVTLHGGEIVNVSRRDNMAAVVTAIERLDGRMAEIKAQLARVAEADVQTQQKVGAQTIQVLRDRSKTADLTRGGRAA
jgi:hypothetical protein